MASNSPSTRMSIAALLREELFKAKQYNEKRLQSFIGWDEILEFMNKRYAMVSEQVVATFTYWCVDNIFYIMTF